MVKQPVLRLTAHLHLVPRSRMVELYFHSRVRLHDVVQLGQLYFCVFYFVGLNCTACWMGKATAENSSKYRLTSTSLHGVMSPEDMRTLFLIRSRCSLTTANSVADSVSFFWPTSLISKTKMCLLDHFAVCVPLPPTHKPQIRSRGSEYTRNNIIVVGRGVFYAVLVV
jgi:hypothetical protein